MRRIPSFFALRAFEAAARLESFALAGEELHLTPSAISHQIRALERYFGQPLFMRNGRRVEPTAPGRQLLARLTRTFDDLEAACAEIGPAARRTEALALHCAPSFAAKWLGPRLPGFMRTHPEIGIRLSASADPIDLMRQDQFDLAIAYGTQPSRQGGVVAEPLGVELVTALIAPSLQSQSPAQLTLIESAISPVRWEDWFAHNHLSSPPQAARPSFDRGAMAISAAAQGLGAVLESTRLAEEELTTGRLVELGGGRYRGLRIELHFLYWRAAQRNLPKIVAFRNWLLDAIVAD
jgi:DNA-binding transcriptional LysR family regulator